MSKADPRNFVVCGNDHFTKRDPYASGDFETLPRGTAERLAKAEAVIRQAKEEIAWAEVALQMVENKLNVCNGNDEGGSARWNTHAAAVTLRRALTTINEWEQSK
jgi:hypothetical protein